jgi:hypothetical protein
MITAELKSHFLRLYQMAFSDDNFDVLEMQMLYKFAEDRGISIEDLNNILLNPFNESSIPESLDKRIEYLYDLSIMILADGVVTDDEQNTLNKYCLKFGFLEENIEDLSEFLLDHAKKNTPKNKLLELIKE